MSKFGGWKGAHARAVLCGLLVQACCVAALGASAKGAGLGVVRAVASQNERVDIRLRSFVPKASGQLTVEPSAEGGKARLTALRLPDPRTQSRDARAYVVWANSDGRIVRLGELTRDSRGNGGLAFAHPGFERYAVIVTAESSAEAARPFGAPVLSTRANEAVAVFPAPAPAANSSARNNTSAPAIPPVSPTRMTHAGGRFFAEVEEAIASSGGGRLIEMEGGDVAPRGRASARTAAQRGLAYIIVRFRDVPLPRTIGAGAYIMWAIRPDGRIVYMGSLPNDEWLNIGDTYVRVPGFNSDEFDLFVTAEQGAPASVPSDRRALSTRNARYTLR